MNQPRFSGSKVADEIFLILRFIVLIAFVFLPLGACKKESENMEAKNQNEKNEAASSQVYPAETHHAKNTARALRNNAVELEKASMTAPAAKEVQQHPMISEPDLINAIISAGDFAELHRVQQLYGDGLSLSVTAKRTLSEKWADLTKSITPRKLVPELEYLAIQVTSIGNNRCKFGVLLRSTGKLRSEYQISVLGKRDPIHLEGLPDAQLRRWTDIWPLREWDSARSNWKYDDMTRWNPGEYHFLAKEAHCLQIPYDLSITLQKWDNGRWVSNYGNMIRIGWYVPSQP